MPKIPKKPILSHREFKRNCIATENPRIVFIKKQAEGLAKRIKKEGVS